MIRIVPASLAIGMICWVCNTPPMVKHEPVPAGQLSFLRNEVRELIRPECGSCHTSTLSTAKPGAVEVFDLVNDDWSATMSGEELNSFRKRLRKLDDSSRTKVEKLVIGELAQQPAGSPID